MTEIQSENKVIQNKIKSYKYAYINNGRTASSVTMIELNVIWQLIDLLTWN